MSYRYKLYVTYVFLYTLLKDILGPSVDVVIITSPHPSRYPWFDWEIITHSPSRAQAPLFCLTFTNVVIR